MPTDTTEALPALFPKVSRLCTDMLQVHKYTEEVVAAPYPAGKEKYVCMCKSDHMSPTLMSGDSLLLDLSMQVSSGDLCAVILKDGSEDYCRVKIEPTHYLFYYDDHQVMPKIVRKELVESLIKIVGSWRSY